MSRRFYQAIQRSGALFRYQCIGSKTLQGPAILAANHQGVIGPIACVLSIPAQLHVWASANLFDRSRIIDHLMDDFVTPVLHLRGKVGRCMAKVLGRIVMPMFEGLEVIPVDRNDIVLSGVFQRSMHYLQQGGLLLVLPEDPDLPADPVSGLKPFMSGYLYLCYLARKQLGKDPPVYPVAVLKARRQVHIGEPLYLGQGGELRQEMRLLNSRLEKAVAALLQAGKQNG